MKNLIILMAMFFTGCAFMSPAPQVVQDVFYDVDSEMGYGGYNKEWTIPPSGAATWLNYGMHGTCSNFASLYRLRLSQAGISEDRMKFKVIRVCEPGMDEQSHAVLIVDDMYVLDNMRSAVIPVEDIYLFPCGAEKEIDMVIAADKEKQGELVYFTEKQKYSTY